MGTYIGAALLQKAERDWAAGKVVPHRITTALDAAGLYGPEVDLACGVEEPAVDLWEAGTLYPTWDQLCALAELVNCSPWFFTAEPHFERPAVAFLCGERTGGCVQVDSSDWVLRFTPDAIAAANLPTPPKPPTPPLPPTGRRRLRRVA